MRLLRWGGQDELALTEDLVDNIPPYAILSHTWGADGDEVTFADLQKNQGREKVGYAKILFCQERARRDGIEYFWVDTCCINKDSHVELSEAITSMFNWYQGAIKCYVYLPDVSTHKHDVVIQDSWQLSFRNSRWFTRGWTLQELLAPRIVKFFSQEKDFLGDKITLAQQIHGITRIPLSALNGTSLTQFPVTERMRWAHGRNTKKKEDRAYCLLGIFQVFMPLIYGEGDNAFVRLQEEIDKQSSQNAVAQHFHNVHRREPEVVRSLGLCLGSAPLINSDDFIGREAEIDQIRTLLQPDEISTEQRRVVLGGMGGIGKTQMALAYSRRHKTSYTSILWLNATTSSTLYASVRSVARGFVAAAVLTTLDDEQVLARAHEWLSHPQNISWLLIFDNYDDPDDFDLEHFCPNAGHGSIIVTTRLPDLVLGRRIRVLPLEEMEDGLRILETRSGRRNVKEDIGAQCLVERLGGLPLALTTAGAYLRRSTISFQAYLDTYQRDWKIDARRPLQLREYQDRTLYTTWNLSYRRLMDDDPDAANMLKILAYFDHQDLWYELFRAGLSDELPSWLVRSLREQTGFESVMRTLVDYCLVELQSTTQSYSIHGCVHDWALGELNSVIDPQLYWFVLQCVARSIDGHEIHAYGQLRYARLSRHAVWLGQHHFSQCHRSGGSLSKHLVEASWIELVLEEQGQSDEADEMYRRIVAGHEGVQELKDEHALIATNALGILHTRRGKLEEAEHMYNRALAGYERTLGHDHIGTVGVVENLGVLYKKQVRLDEAEQMFNRALVRHERVLGPSHQVTLGTVYNLGRLYIKQGRLTRGEEMLNRALTGQEKALGVDHVATLGTVIHLGCFYYEQGRFDEAEPLFRRIVSGQIETLGQSHPRVSDMNLVLKAIQLKKRGSKVEDVSESDGTSADESRLLPT